MKGDSMVEDFCKYMTITDGIAVSDVLSWLLAAIGGIIVYKAIDHIQTSMERHGMLKDIEHTFSEIYNSVIAKSRNNKKNRNLQNVMVRSVLHDDGNWETIIQTDINGQNKLCNKRKILDNQRYIQIRNGLGKKPKEFYRNEWISTQALHEILKHCQRVTFQNHPYSKMKSGWPEIAFLIAS